ncbi:MAG TPA: hypothetical protein ENJ61_00330 [Aquifex aeolicus]|uniref:C-type lectin domain-containing protein n=1 Tax=Aquifex aeolicus TaxID=63363 RepID=A0A7C5L1M6_AQUAO|nr:hypothetical protein [Aquifex aeolicus]
MRRLLTGTLLFWKIGFSAFFCADTGLYYSDQTFCSSVCSNPCEVLLAGDQGLTCDTLNYELFVYNPQTNKTIAITKSSDFWDQFSGLLVVEDASDNEAGRQILSYLNTTAWIGLYDPDLSPSYNSVNPSRFVWWDGTPVSYANWNTGEPDNFVDTQDIGSVSPLGEHWVYMDAGGMWSDDGLHLSYGGDYRPRRRALVMWDGQLDCVNGLPQNDRTTTNDMINLYCGGQTPCYLCADGSSIDACTQGDVWGTSSAGWLCPLEKTSCVQSFSCPQGGTYNRSTGVCEADPDISCPPGGSYNAQTGRCEAQPL